VALRTEGLLHHVDHNIVDWQLEIVVVGWMEAPLAGSQIQPNKAWKVDRPKKVWVG